MFGVEWMDALTIGVLGLMIGSFLNVVIHRVPLMMERQWETEYDLYGAELAAKAAAEATLGSTPEAGAPAPEAEAASKTTDKPAFNLMTPASRCPHCGHAIRWYENIPVLSYIALGGKCSGCKARISPRYPLVELVTGAFFYLCATQWGWSITTLMWCGFSAAVITLAMIDWDTTLLPDDITLPLLWAGLIGSALQWLQVPLHDSVMGAVAGYLSLWLVYWGFKLVTGKEGMGYGDFKLFAALGAWFGWTALVPIILMASGIGAIVGIAMKLSSTLREGGYVPFGPFLAGAGLTAMAYGPQKMLQVVLSAFGL